MEAKCRLDINKYLNYRHSRVERRVNMMEGSGRFSRPGIFAMIIEKREKELCIPNQSVKERREREPHQSFSFFRNQNLSLVTSQNITCFMKLINSPVHHSRIRKSRDCFICANIPFSAIDSNPFIALRIERDRERLHFHCNLCCRAPAQTRT